MNYLVRHVLALLAAVVGTSAAAQDADLRDWEAANSAKTREAFEGYLTAHPAGRFSRQALLAIVRQAGESKIETEASDDAILPAGGAIPVLY